VKRVVIAIVGTVAGLVALLGYKSGPVKRAQLLGPEPTTPASPTSPTSPTSPASNAPPAVTAPPTLPPQGGGDDNIGGDDGGGDDGGGGVAPAPAAPPTAAPPAATPTTGAPSAGTGSGTRTVTGPDVPNRFGDVQVQLVMQGSKIIDVKPLQMPYDRQRSYEISQAAAPLLRQEVLQAQSANIDLLSGATYTSQSYAESVQAALDQARK
jgi:uncharacterized protein with FMN-binding domain